MIGPSDVQSGHGSTSDFLTTRLQGPLLLNVLDLIQDLNTVGVCNTVMVSNVLNYRYVSRTYAGFLAKVLQMACTLHWLYWSLVYLHSYANGSYNEYSLV